MAEDLGLRLHSKEFWDKHYAIELNNFETMGDEGDIWFGKTAENRILQFLINRNIAFDCPILDVGCGNGSLLRKLNAHGYANLSGADYSENAIQLAKQTSIDLNINYFVAGFTTDERLLQSLVGRFEILIDKGTWDAISLGDDEQHRLLHNYRRSILESFANVASNRYFIIVSCNFTRDELIDQFTLSDKNAADQEERSIPTEQQAHQFRYICDLATANSFSYGGGSGVTATGIVFFDIIVVFGNSCCFLCLSRLLLVLL